MISNKPHLTALLRELRRDEDAPAFFIGYFLTDVEDETICAALAAWRRHQQDLAELMRPADLAVVDD